MIRSADPPPRVAFSTLAFPDATLASAVSLGRRWSYAGVELRLIDGELIDPSMPAAERGRIKLLPPSLLNIQRLNYLWTIREARLTRRGSQAT